MSVNKKITSSRRSFLGNTIKIAAVGAWVLPIQNALANSAMLVIKAKQRARKFLLYDKLILNTKSKVVHLPTGKIFNSYADIDEKNQKVLDLKTWEAQVKAPIHFNKGKSGIILELLALQKLTTGITDKNLASATNTIALAFTPGYRDKKGIALNKHNFRLHELLAQLIALNNSIPVAQKWTKFDGATGKMNQYIMLASIKNPLPPRVKWMFSKKAFDERVSYILKNKNDYTDRLTKRAAACKFS